MSGERGQIDSRTVNDSMGVKSVDKEERHGGREGKPDLGCDESSRRAHWPRNAANRDGNVRLPGNCGAGYAMRF